MTEFQPVLLDESALDRDVAETIWRQYGKAVKVEFPSPQTAGQWKLTAQGWCGFLPLEDGYGLELRPKVSVQSVWRMLDYAYFTNIQLFDDKFDCKTFPELIERLAAILAARVLERSRRGLYRTYVTESARLSCVRGRIDTTRTLRTPWVPEPHCRYQRHTSDIEDNRILTWTLQKIARSGLCHEPNRGRPGGALPAVRQAYRTLSGATSLQPYSGRDCRGRRYNRLNGDYAVLHALCRFFLDFLAPGHIHDRDQDNAMLPFLIPMDKLFEDYVAMWLRRHLESGWKARRQEKYDIDPDGQYFQIDIVLYDAYNRARCVIDTKYKAPESGRPSTDDIAQVIAYAVAKGCQDAVLLYPEDLAQPLDAVVNGIRVRTLIFPLDQSPDIAGQNFLQQLDEGQFVERSYCCTP